MGDYLKDKLFELQDKHSVIGDVRGKGLFCGIELVKDRATKEPLTDQNVASITGHCLKNKVMVGRTNRSFVNANNVLLFSPAFVVTKGEIDLIVDAVDKALTANTLGNL